MMKLLNNRWGSLAYNTGISILIPLILGGVFALIAGGHYIRTIEFCYLLFCAPITVNGLLQFVLIKKDIPYGLGCALYYGWLIASMIFKYLNNYYIDGFVCALLCVIIYILFYLKDDKNKLPNENVKIEV